MPHDQKSLFKGVYGLCPLCALAHTYLIAQREATACFDIWIESSTPPRAPLRNQRKGLVLIPPEIGTPGVNQQSASPSLIEEVPDRKTIREAIERTTRERNRTQLLLFSFTTVSGYEAVKIFNRRKYEDMMTGNCGRAELSFVAETITI